MSFPLHILFQARRDILTSRGGDAVQFHMTKKYLEKLGVCVEVDLSHSTDLKNYDIVHLFNLTRPYDTVLNLRNAKKQGKPVCLSTIYWNMDELRNLIALKEPFWLSAARRCKLLLKQVLSLANAKLGHNMDEASVMKNILSIKKLQREVLEGADMLLPNSTTELNLLKKDFPSISSKPAKVVYNCIDGEVYSYVTPLNRELEQKKRSEDFLLTVGRIEQRKNQVSLLNAMRSTDIPVVMVGDVSNRSYYRCIKANIKKKDRLLPARDNAELKPIYSSARVHALPSFYDTPGLVSLEAGACGCNLIMSDIGSQREYFGDLVEYCDPYSVESIREAVERAWEKPWPNLELASYIRKRYTWKVAAKQTHEAYMKLLQGIK